MVHRRLTPLCRRHPVGPAAALYASNRVCIEETLLGANRVHDALCAPPLQRIGNYEMANSIVPTRYVSGDFVVSFQQEGSWYVALGDLMGKGLSAAMWLAHAVDLLRRACDPGGSLADAMRRLNREMHESRTGVPLAALFLCRLEPNDGCVTYSAAGCPPAFVLGTDNHVSVHDHGGPILGALGHSEYQDGQIHLARGETLLAVSDGIIEFHRGIEFELRPDRVIQHMQHTAGESATDVVNSLTDRIKGLSSSMVDDLTVLAIKRIA